MRFTKILLTILLLAGLTFSCGESELEEVLPTASIAPQAINSADALEKLLIGAYDRLQQGGAATNLYYLSLLTEDLSADNLIWRATFFQHGEIDNNAILAGNVLVTRYWSGPYETVFVANQILEILPNIDASTFPGNPQRKDEIQGEAKFIRALAYFRLVSLFGGVPINTVNTLENKPRNTADEVYTQIISDLDDAISLAPDFSDQNFSSKDAARALRARVALIRGDFATAATMAEAVIANSTFALSNNYAAIFAPSTGGLGSSEIIFQVSSTLTDATFPGFFLTDASNPFGSGGRLELPADPTLVAAYEPGDQRFAASIDQTFVRPGFSQAIKFGSGLNGDDPFPVSRISEMHLISAEAAAERDNNANSGLARLNEVRFARSLPALTGADVPDLSTFQDRVLQERRVELAFEGHRWRDLIRTNRAISTIPTVTSADQLLYPIPQRELDNNPNLVQNPGY